MDSSELGDHNQTRKTTIVYQERRAGEGGHQEWRAEEGGQMIVSEMRSTRGGPLQES
jgi:hypothetical protein